MQLNRQTDYALRTLIFLAMRNDLSTIDDIAKKFLIAREHLTKIISRLAKLNYVITIRGKGGGLKLNPKVLTVSLAKIIKHFEPTFKAIDCHQLQCPIREMCRLQQILHKASNAFLNTLNEYTLQDILPKSSIEKLNIATMLGIETKVKQYDSTY